MKITNQIFHITERDYYLDKIIINGNGRIHEVITPSGNILYSNIAISHKKIHINDAKRNLNIFSKMISDNIIFNPREQFYYARELYYNGEYTKAIENFNKFLDSKDGWIENNIEACLNLSYCYNLINNSEKRLEYLFKSFEYDTPRAEICCEIGNLFKDVKYYEIAIFWYKLAISCNINDRTGGFVINDCYDYIPYIQLCVCYHGIDDIKNAVIYNNKAGAIKPKDKSYLYNKKYFKSLT